MTSRRREIAARRRQKLTGAGTPSVAPPAFLSVGILRRPHGVQGEMLMTVQTDFPERLKAGTTLYLGEKHELVILTKTRHHNQGLIVSFEGYATREDVENMRNAGLFVRADDRPPLPVGEYYLHEIFGLTVVTDEGLVLGSVTDWIETGANGVWVVRSEEGVEVLLPDIDDVVLKIDLEKKQMLVHLLEGLI